nr:immunoglobulin light chain junction region [Macaca mulatta]MOV86004.1 immunoglobulin light chain junction region [Macaca mulatta]
CQQRNSYPYMYSF